MKPRTFTAHERTLLGKYWLARHATDPARHLISVAEWCRLLGCSSKTLVREVRALGLPLRKPQREWNAAA